MYKQTSTAIFLIVILLIWGSSCRQGKKTDISFYYWKSTIAQNEKEADVLRQNDVSDLYLRYFDITLNERNQPVPEAPLQGNMYKNINVNVIPVIYIRNNVFKKADEKNLALLAKDCAAFIREMNSHFGTAPHEIQFDCDWTSGTRQKYFRFLQLFKKEYPIRLSATIRLHQYKYPAITGVPPVEKGTLMYYNMGEIASDTLNSVYDRKKAVRYLTPKSPYPIPLNVALPIFNWGVRIRNGKVVQLLSKLSEREIAADTHFRKLTGKRYENIQSCFFHGFYFKKGDVVKIESISSRQLLEMADDLKKGIKTGIKEIIFYDLDTLNTNKYEKNIFQEVADRIR